MKIHTRTVYDFMTGDVLEDDWYEYEGEVSKAGGGNGGSPTATTTTVQPPQFAVPYMQQVLGEAQRQFQAGPAQPYPGQTLAPVTPQQTQALQQIETGVIPQAQQTAQQTAQAQRDLFARADPTANPYFEQMMQGIIDPLTSQLTSQILPQISRGAVSAGQFGGARQGVLERGALSDYEANVLAQTGQLAGQLWQQGTGALQTGAELSPLVQRQQLIPSQLLSQVGQTQRGYQQETIQDLVARYQAEQAAPGAGLEQYAGILSGIIPGLGQTSTGMTTQATGGTSPISSAVGGAATGYALAGMTQGAVAGPVGAIAGGILGLLMS